MYHGVLGLGLSRHIVGLRLGLQSGAQPEPKLAIDLAQEYRKKPGPITSMPVLSLVNPISAASLNNSP